jgi:chorismate mutase/prephenate dehydratase
MSQQPQNTEAQRLEPLRQKIDELDRALLDLLAKRAAVAVEVGHVKEEFGSVVYRPEREQQVLDKVANNNPGPLKSEGVKAIWREIMSACRAIEATTTISYLGPAGTFSEEATLAFFGHSVETSPCQSLDEIFRQVESGQTQYGVVPIENSSEGAISRTLDLLLESNLLVTGEISIPIRHTLMSLSGNLDGVTHVLAHPQALAQCQQWLNANAPKLHREAISSNAQAAVESSKNAQYAAIASSSAVLKYGLKSVQEAIQDDAHNRTRFVVIGHHTASPTQRDQTSLILSVKNEAGAVYRLLEPFAKHGVSMTRFESRPARKGTWEYHFYIDIDGHQNDISVAAALEDLKKITAFYKCLGSYPKSHH